MGRLSQHLERHLHFLATSQTAALSPKWNTNRIYAFRFLWEIIPLLISSFSETYLSHSNKCEQLP